MKKMIKDRKFQFQADQLFFHKNWKLSSKLNYSYQQTSFQGIDFRFVENFLAIKLNALDTLWIEIVISSSYYRLTYQKKRIRPPKKLFLFLIRRSNYFWKSVMKLFFMFMISLKSKKDVFNTKPLMPALAIPKTKLSWSLESEASPKHIVESVITC